MPLSSFILRSNLLWPQAPDEVVLLPKFLCILENNQFLLMTMKSMRFRDHAYPVLPLYAQQSGPGPVSVSTQYVFAE